MSVTITREKLHHQAECSFRAGRIGIAAKISAEQPKEAVDLLVDRVEGQIRKAKTKLADKSAASRAKADVKARSMENELTAEAI